MSGLAIGNVASGRRVNLNWGSPNYNATNALNNMFALPPKLIIFFDLHFTLYQGGTPYPTISNRELLGVLNSGYRMEKPEMCWDEM